MFKNAKKIMYKIKLHNNKYRNLTLHAFYLNNFQSTNALIYSSYHVIWFIIQIVYSGTSISRKNCNSLKFWLIEVQLYCVMCNDIILVTNNILSCTYTWMYWNCLYKTPCYIYFHSKRCVKLCIIFNYNYFYFVMYSRFMDYYSSIN